MAILLIENNKRWKEIGGRILTPIHDEILAEVPMEEAIFDYMTRFHVSESEFIDHIEQKVKYGN